MRTVLGFFDSGLFRSLAAFHNRLLTKESSPLTQVPSAAKEYHEMEH